MPPGGSIGDPCDTNKPCRAGLTCIDQFPFSAQPKGYCTAPCSKLGNPCPGAPAKTQYLCALKMGSDTYCMFICGVWYGGKPAYYPCPKKLTCETLKVSGQKISICAP